uniref:Uncharacterized protein n=1 Tax=Trichobilharzia regenti TaxID=157069 RepID=A0AA85KKG4_TRIRE|nr:unnamed protein product [Trichobilharzia regenti]
MASLSLDKIRQKKRILPSSLQLFLWLNIMFCLCEVICSVNVGRRLTLPEEDRLVNTDGVEERQNLLRRLISEIVYNPMYTAEALEEIRRYPSMYNRNRRDYLFLRG